MDAQAHLFGYQQHLCPEFNEILRIPQSYLIFIPIRHFSIKDIMAICMNSGYIPVVFN